LEKTEKTERDTGKKPSDPRHENPDDGMTTSLTTPKVVSKVVTKVVREIVTGRPARPRDQIPEEQGRTEAVTTFESCQAQSVSQSVSHKNINPTGGQDDPGDLRAGRK